jgi:RHS repeat-associated protein
MISGWTIEEWLWEICDEGTYKGTKVEVPATVQAFYQPFHFSRPIEYTFQEVKGEFTANGSTEGASDPGIAKVTTATEGALESSSVPRQWLIWVLEGEHGASPLAMSPEEEYGSGNGASPHKTRCMLGKPVNCATGNETENQTDLRVGGRGPGLSLTRTYNSQLAAKQSSPGSFGYGWSAPYSAHVEISGELATVYQSDGSTVRFLASGEQWVPAAPLVQATLAKEGSGYKYTLPDQTVLHFNSLGQLTSQADRNGNTLTMSYESKGRLESVSDPAGRKLTFAYNSEGFVESAKDPMGHTVKYTYEGKSLVSVTQPAEAGLQWKFKYDGSHQMTEMVDGRGHAITTEYDGSHRVIVQTDALSRKRTWKYGTITEGTYTEITEPNGSVTREEFNVDGLPSKVTRAYGTSLASSTSSEYDALYNLIATTDPNGHKTQYEYNAAGDRTGETDANNNETSWVYDAQHNPISVTTPKGETTTIKRDSHGNAESVSRPAPKEATQTTKYAYDSHGDVESMTDPLGRTWKYEYDTYGDRTAEIDPESDKHTWAYNEDSQEVAMVSQRGNVVGGRPAEFTTKTTRDAQGRPVAVSEQSGELGYGFQIGTVGSENGQLKEPTGEVVTAGGNVDVVDRGNNRVEEFSANGEFIGKFGSSGTEKGQFKSPYAIAIDSKGDLWVADEGNNRVQEFNEKHEAILMFGSEGTAGGQFKEPKSIAVAPNGNVYVSDAMNERVEQFNEKGEFLAAFGWGVSDGKTEFEICKASCRGGFVGSGNGEFNAIRGVTVAANGNVWVADAANNRIQEFNNKNEYVSQFGSKGTNNGQFKEPKGIATDAAGNVWVADSLNNRIQKFTPSGGFLTTFGNPGAGNGQFAEPFGIAFAASGAAYIADIKNNRVEEWAPIAAVTEYKYDGDGNVEQVTDPNRNKTKYTYNADNQPIKVEAPNKTITETGYDGAGRVTSQVDGNKHETKYVRNILGEVTEVVDPLGRKTTKEYDAAGNLKILTDPAKRTTTYTYDPANRLTEVSYSDGKTHAVKYEYDADGDRTKITDGTGTTTYSYDQLDRLTESKDGHGDTAGYEYDLANEQTKITYPGGKAVTRSYDKAARLEKLTDWLEHTTTFAYDPDSNLTTVTFPSGTSNVDKYAYNEPDQMSEAKMTKGTETLASLLYTRDNTGQVKTITSKGLPGSETSEYAYDENNRLTNAGTTPYEYDAADNPTKTGSSTNTYDNADQLKTGTGQTYTYDELGERTKTTPTTGPATTDSYDQAGNLTGVERPKEGETAEIKDTYTYDGNGLRASQTISATTSYLTWDMSEGLPLILNDGANSYIYGLGGLPVEQISSGGTVTYLHHDQQGSIHLLTGSTGTVTGSTTFDAYGNKTGSTGSSITPLGYDAQYTSSDTGLIYLRARVYDPATAQFLSSDPLKAITGEPYAYAGDNPLNASDPTGLIFGISGTPSWEELGEGVAGWGDTLTFGATNWAREELGINNVDSCSGAYQAGGYAGLATAALIPGEGEVEFGAEGISLSAKIAGQMEARGWTEESIQEAIKVGDQVQAVNKATGNPATRYINPTTGQSVVVDDVTKEVIHVGGPGFKYGTGSGDLP